jgi:hypothetical protein|nr:MAG TPA: hypothetical protein [Caudoviricetes sp.]
MLYLLMFKIAAASLITTLVLVVITRGLDINDGISVTIGGLALIVTLLTSFLAAWMWVFNI